MAGKSRLPKLTLHAGQMSELQQLSQSRTAPLREVQRARILCHYHAGETIAGIARALEMTRKSVRKWIDKALAMGAEAALKDAYHRPRAPVITEQARAWVVHLACSKPKELGYAAELWTRSLLARHVRREAAQAGHPSLSRAAKATVQRILAELSDNYRRVLELRFLHGYSLKEVAAEMHSTVGAVKVMQLRALRAAAKVKVE